ncbi:hypothetical protein HYH03_008830 [Edaphochlamys debaryana]|uniref:Uncharacterized protein n=1 Tax=Edaphochlamys debaryana TaxID=47281 RepID=A0A835XXH9_9CHLO|nr:hypothetical protein HYH03_008830 [Edaphochlamys debaryana]|eukprot:KAG2492917.1 hypothetical protein HYH03_008830 [Edaphochlamys debaryana]
MPVLGSAELSVPEDSLDDELLLRCQLCAGQLGSGWGLGTGKARACARCLEVEPAPVDGGKTGRGRPPLNASDTGSRKRLLSGSGEQGPPPRITDPAGALLSTWPLGSANGADLVDAAVAWQSGGSLGDNSGSGSGSGSGRPELGDGFRQARAAVCLRRTAVLGGAAAAAAAAAGPEPSKGATHIALPPAVPAPATLLGAVPEYDGSGSGSGQLAALMAALGSSSGRRPGVVPQLPPGILAPRGGLSGSGYRPPDAAAAAAAAAVFTESPAAAPAAPAVSNSHGGTNAASLYGALLSARVSYGAGSDGQFETEMLSFDEPAGGAFMIDEDDGTAQGTVGGTAGTGDDGGYGGDLDEDAPPRCSARASAMCTAESAGSAGSGGGARDAGSGSGGRPDTCMAQALAAWLQPGAHAVAFGSDPQAEAEDEAPGPSADASEDTGPSETGDTGTERGPEGTDVDTANLGPSGASDAANEAEEEEEEEEEEEGAGGYLPARMESAVDSVIESVGSADPGSAMALSSAGALAPTRFRDGAGAGGAVYPSGGAAAVAAAAAALLSAAAVLAPAELGTGLAADSEASDAAVQLPMLPDPVPPALLPPHVYLAFVAQLVASVGTATLAAQQCCYRNGFGCVGLPSGPGGLPASLPHSEDGEDGLGEAADAAGGAQL